MVNLASCCKPVFGEDIVGYITKGQGITVHRATCQNIKNVSTRLIDVSWNLTKSDDMKQYVSKMTLITNGLNNSVLDIVTKATLRNVSVSSINELNKNGVTYYDMLVKVHNKDDLDLFIDEIKTLPFVEDVRRS